MPTQLTPLLLASALVSVIVATAPAQSNTALMANDHYTRSHDYDLVHQRIEVSHFNWDSTSFDGEVTTTVVSRQPDLEAVALDEGHLLHNTRVTDVAGHTLVAAQLGDTVFVRPRRALQFGDTLVFTIRYHARIESGSGLTFITSDGLPHRPDQIWSQGEDMNNHDWFPTYDFPNDKMTWELIATVPRNDLAISNGRLVSNVVSGRDRTMRWNQDKPSATYLVSLIVAPLVLTHDTWQGVPVDYYTYRADSSLAWRLFHVTPDMIDVYSRLTGIRYPWAKYAQTTVADFFGGMENVSATTLVDWLPDATAYRDRPWYQYILIPHELAHQWFGDYVTTENWANTWLNEGFAEFMPGQYWHEKLGAHAEEDYYLDEYRQYLALEARRSMPLASMGSNNIYPKGALVLKMLKDYLGPERFWSSLHTYLHDHAFGVATTDDLRQAFLAATGQNLDWFWSEWIYGAGEPAFTVKASYDSTRHQLAVSVKQTQTDTFTADTSGRVFRVAPVFRMPVTIRIGFQGGDMLYHGQIDAREQTFTIDSVRSRPTMVVFDEGNHILKTLDFEQPVAWLAEELQRDPDLWDRQWAIEQLATHPADHDATFALTQAATGADYYLTRVQAIDALGAFPATTAMGSLTDATKDTSAAVRAAAIETMGRFGGPDVVAAARRAFAHDSSYTVRAAAIGALVRADPSHASAVLAEAMTTPSYRDAIADAAFEAVAETNDTAMIAAVDSAAATSELPSHILAALAARGSGHAGQLLRAELDDPRPVVRRWAVNAYTNTMAAINHNAALDQLRAAVGTLRYDDTRKAVTALIANLAATN